MARGVAHVEVDTVQQRALLDHHRRDLSEQLGEVVHLFNDLVNLCLPRNDVLVRNRHLFLNLHQLLASWLAHHVQLRSSELLVALDAVNALEALKLVFFDLSESARGLLKPSVVVLLHVCVDLLVETLALVFLLLHLRLGLLEFLLKLLDPLVKTRLAPLDLQVELVVGGLVEVLLEPADRLLLQHIQVFVNLAELVLELFGGLHPERRQGLLLVQVEVRVCFGRFARVFR